jgi:L-lactate dehydrogenase complex protein LldG
MTGARDEILARVRQALADRPQPAPPARAYRTAGTAEVDLNLFAARVREYGAAVIRCEPADVAAQITAALRRRAARRVAVPAGFPVEWEPEADLLRDDPRLTTGELDLVDGVITGCAVAIAETGTVVLDHGAGQGRRALTLVPDYHLVIVGAQQVVALVPDGIAALDPARPQTWISGPSATSDIELRRVEGVHGPRTLEVLLVG